MALNAITTIADMQIVPEKFSTYVTEKTTEKSAMVNAGIATGDALVGQLINGTPSGGRFITIPAWQPLDASTEEDVFGEGEVSVRYQLDGEYSRLTFLLSPDQKWGCSPDHGTYQLSVLCDGAEVYHSDWLDYAQNDWVEADVSGCETLEIVLRERPGVKGTLNLVLAEPELV